MKFPMIIVLAALSIWAVAMVYGILSADAGSPELDAFAQCLSGKGAVVYGADWCPHCQNQKKMFGSSYDYIPYVECPENPKKCIEAGISGYPTWIFPDGLRLEGEQSFDALSQASGCEFQR